RAVMNQPMVARMGLRALQTGESTELVERILRGSQVPQQVWQSILEKAEGNPFFIEQLAIAVRDASAGGDGASDETFLPTTIEEVIGARVDRLPASRKAALQCGSVIGRVFPESLLQRIRGGAPEAVAADLHDLCNRYVLRAGVPAAPLADHGHAFRHALIHEITYQTILLARRRELHRLIAEAIEPMAAGGGAAIIAQLAFHYQRSDRPSLAVGYLIAAGELAVDVFANSEAEVFFDSALALVDASDTTRRFPALMGLALVLSRTGRFELARSRYEEALRCSPNGTTTAGVHRLVGESLVAQHLSDDAWRAFDSALSHLPKEMADDPVNWREWLQIKLGQLHICYLQARAADARRILHEVADPIRQFGSTSDRARVLRAEWGQELRARDYVPDANTLSIARDHRAVASTGSDYVERGTAEFSLGLTLLLSGDYGPAAEQLQRALEMSREIGDVPLETFALTYLTMQARFLGDVELTASRAAVALGIAGRANMNAYVGMARGHLAWVALRRGDLDDAERHATSAIAEWNALPNRYPFFWIAGVPLMECELQKQSDGWTDIADRMLLTGQHQLPMELAATLRSARRAKDVNDGPGTTDALSQFRIHAREKGYL
ncbi:MAG: hypothetical protein ABIS27_02665, partial [Longimicrobiales bacterium]